MSQTPNVDRQAIHADLERAREEFHELLAAADPASLRRKTDGTAWTNEQMLFHMLLGYLVVRTLLRLVRFMGRRPPRVAKAFAATLDASARPFHLTNYWGSRAGALVFNRKRVGRGFDRTIAVLHRRLDAESEDSLQHGMYFPPRWDPFFEPHMTLAEVYRYPNRHFDFHKQQLTLGPPKS